MNFNPIIFAHEVNSQFIRYQLTAFPLSDPDIASQVKQILAHGMTEKSPLFKGPYLSLSRSFAEGDAISSLIQAETLHPAIKGVVNFDKVFRHQQKSFEAVQRDHHCLITTGTGSGKTEAFLIPIIDYCLKLRDQKGVPKGITAIIIYPMNALALDQLERLREMLAGTNISFAMYVGSTPKGEGELAGSVQLKEGEGSAELLKVREKYKGQNVSISPWEERRTREEIIANPPRILLTNVNQLEFLLTRSSDIGLFTKSQLKFLVMDEAHTYSGALGAEVACLLRRLRTMCGKNPDEVICLGTSATIVNQNSPQQPAQEFMNRLFGINPQNVEIIAEEYDTIKWPSQMYTPPLMTADPIELLNQVLQNMEKENNEQILKESVHKLTRLALDVSKPWANSLFDQLLHNIIVKTIYEELEDPAHLDEAVKKVFQKLNRPFVDLDKAKAELLCYLALGAVANNGDPLLRPKLHYFIRGLRGVSTVLEENTEGQSHPKIYFDATDAIQANPDILPTAIFPVFSCMNCGQHYFETWLDNVDESQKSLGGGAPDGNNIFWSQLDEEKGTRFLFIDRFVSEDFEDDNEEYKAAIEAKRTSGFICRFCGTLHKNADNECHNPQCRKQGIKLLPVFVIKQKEKIESCPSCGYLGPRRGNDRLEPIRRLRAVTVADIHILAQDLINSQPTDQKKLIIFSDNRQDAAFQAAWINQRARRYRFRHLLYSILKSENKVMGIGDLVDKLYDYFKNDDRLARYLAPEVYSTESDDAFSDRVQRNLKKYIRIMILLELTQAMKWRRNLEAWGLVRIEYAGIIDPKNEPRLTDIAQKFSLQLDKLKEYLESLLDLFRRNYKTLYDPFHPIFDKFWHEGNEDIQHGYVPSNFINIRPAGIAFEKDDNNRSYARPLFSKKGTPVPKELAIKCGVPKEKIKEFMEAIWSFLKDSKLILPVELKSQRGDPLPHAVDLYHIDNQQIGLRMQSELYRCSICQRIHTRPTSSMNCTAYRCKGTLVKQTPSDDDYDIRILSQEFTMIVAREHTAQVPPKLREEYEKEFKGEKRDKKEAKETGITKSEKIKNQIRVNCLVASPTLELGVDIGSLDVVLLRNVPPLSSNYWQRAGRAGRRHRMALIYTYCRQSIHDDYFFEDPLRMLSQKITAPKFNLKNPVMIEKHVHASILSKIACFGSASSLSSLETDLKNEFPNAFPKFLKHILFDGRIYRKTPFNIDKFEGYFTQYAPNLISPIGNIFQNYWPIEAQTEVEAVQLERYIISFISQIKNIYLELFREMKWVVQTRKKLQEQSNDELLDDMQRKLLWRCHKWIDHVKEDNIQNYLLSIFSDRGFLPNYIGMGGNIVASVGEGYSPTWRKIDFELNRSALIALHEFAPGNLIYANGGKYRTAFFHFPIKEDSDEPVTAILPDTYLYNPAIKRIIEKGQPIAGYSTGDAVEMDGIPISNLDLAFLTHVSDDDDYRFRLACRIVGYLQNSHRGGRQLKANTLEIQHLYGQKIRFVNIGPVSKEEKLEYGFPICIVCGATRSPFASQREIDYFTDHHEKKTCGKPPKNYALTTNADVDCLVFKGFQTNKDAINYAEAIRMGASIILEMNRDDLDLLLLPQTEDQFDIILYDPMPGGSGLLGQIIERWKEVIETALKALECPNKCQKSCYICMRTYRNIFFHEELDRTIASNLLTQHTNKIHIIHDIPPKMETQSQTGTSTNWTEQWFRELFHQHGFPPFEAQKKIELMGSIKSTTPDFYYEDSPRGKKLAIYIDGLSRNIHGNVDRERMDKLIEQVLENFLQTRVVRIPASAKSDPKMLEYSLQQIGEILK